MQVTLNVLCLKSAYKYTRQILLQTMWQVLIKQMESSDSVYTISSAISNLLSLTQDGPQLCSIIAKVRLHSFKYQHALGNIKK